MTGSGVANRWRAMAAAVLASVIIGPATAERIEIQGPVGSVQFGAQILPLPNGNFVVTDPSYSAPGPISSVGAVYLFAPDGALISQLTGAQAGDSVGIEVVVLANGNFVVRSPFWRIGDAPGFGAVTWVNGATGLNGVVSEANSLVGSNGGDYVGDHVVALSNGHYVVLSPSWRNGGQDDAGAITWGDGTAGIHGPVTPANSLLGSTSDDRVGDFNVLELTNGNYVVASRSWNGGTGAVTWFPGGQAKSGVLSSANSLTGTASVGTIGLTALPNGNYFVRSPGWNDGVQFGLGALTWGNGETGTVGAISAANSIIGSTPGDEVGASELIIVGGSNVVHPVPTWDNGGAVDAGAVVWANGEGGTVGPVSSANALVGSTSGDQVGIFGAASIQVLDNGNYIVSSPDWHRGAVQYAGAVTWGSGVAGVTGPITLANSLIGSKPDDGIGWVRTLRSGHAVSTRPLWDNGAITDAGAVSWLSGVAPTTGEISPSNSLVGSRPNDRVGINGVEPLSNGHYVVMSPNWSTLAAASVGAVTWCDGFSGRVGAITSANSLVGTNPMDQVGDPGLLALANGNFVVRSKWWNNGVAVDVGAITWGDGVAGISGPVSVANSFVGNSLDSPVGEPIGLSTGGFVLVSREWDGTAANVGAAKWSAGLAPLTGVHSTMNSVVGENSWDLGAAEVIDLGNAEFLLTAPGWDHSGTMNIGAVRGLAVDSVVSGPLCAAQCQFGLGPEDLFGAGEPVVYPDGYYVLPSEFFNHNGMMHVGALTFGRRGSLQSGPVTPANTLIGEVQFGSSGIKFARFGTRSKFVVSGLAPNQVVLFDWSLFADGFE